MDFMDEHPVFLQRLQNPDEKKEIFNVFSTENHLTRNLIMRTYKERCIKLEIAEIIGKVKETSSQRKYEWDESSNHSDTKSPTLSSESGEQLRQKISTKMSILINLFFPYEKNVVMPTNDK
jgi:hypothetical protein